MIRKISHKTEYHFDTPVHYALQRLRLRPQSGPLQNVTSWDVLIDGGIIETSYNDHYGNSVDLVSAAPGTEKLMITARGEVDVKDQGGVFGKSYGRAPLWHFLQTTPLTERSESIVTLADKIVTGNDMLADLHALSAAILEVVPYKGGYTDTTTTADDAMRVGKGVCQDHSHIFITAARHLGVPARYVSGYLYMSDREDQDASHGWAEAHIDGLGWVGFDVSNGISPDANYIRIAIGRDAQDATPVTGLRMGSGQARMVVSLQVQQ